MVAAARLASSSCCSSFAALRGIPRKRPFEGPAEPPKCLDARKAKRNSIRFVACGKVVEGGRKRVHIRAWLAVAAVLLWRSVAGCAVDAALLDADTAAHML